MVHEWITNDLTKDLKRDLTWKEFDERLLAKERSAAKDLLRKTDSKRKRLHSRAASLYTVAGTKSGCVSVAWQEFSEIDPWEHKQFDVS